MRMLRPVWPWRQNQDHLPRPDGSMPEAVMLEVIEPEPKRKVPPNSRRWKLSCVLWLEMVCRGSSDQNHSHREVPFGILLQFRLALQPAKTSRSIWEIKERSSVTLEFWKLVVGKPSMLQNPIWMWPLALGQGRGSPKVESGGKIDTELLFKLLLLLCSWSSTGVGWGVQDQTNWEHNGGREGSNAPD